MPNDTILHFRDYQEEPGQVLYVPKSYSHGDYLRHYYRLYQGEELPETAAPSHSVYAVVDHGRWVCECSMCRIGILVDRDTTAIICPVCAYYGWMAVVWPDDKAGVEAELLRQPGYRLLAPIRDWKPDWTLEHLETRTKMAQEKQEAGKLLRSLSIGTTRIWTMGEVLTANNCRVYISDIEDDLAGRNGVTLQEDSLAVLDGPDGDRYIGIPGGTTAQRPAAPGPGAIRWNTDDNALDVFGTTWAQMLTSAAVNFANLNANGGVGTGAGQAARGNHTHEPQVQTVRSGSYNRTNINSDWVTAFEENMTGAGIYFVRVYGSSGPSAFTATGGIRLSWRGEVVEFDDGQTTADTTVLTIPRSHYYFNTQFPDIYCMWTYGPLLRGSGTNMLKLEVQATSGGIHADFTAHYRVMRVHL